MTNFNHNFKPINYVKYTSGAVRAPQRLQKA